MIRVVALPPNDPCAPEDIAVRLWVIGREDLLKLQALIERALNTAPEFGQEWFELSDKLNMFLDAHKISR